MTLFNKSRRCWARNPNAKFAAEREMAQNPKFQVTLPNIPKEDLLVKEFPGAKI